MTNTGSRIFMAFLIAAFFVCQPVKAPTQEPGSPEQSGEKKDSVEELANSLLRSGAISQSDWWKILNLRSSERKGSAPAAQKNQVPASIPAAVQLPVQQAALSQTTPALGKDITMKIGALGQFRHTWADAASNAINTSAFAVKTARVKFSGDLPKKFKYSFQFAFERANGAATQMNSALYDFALLYAPKTWLSLTMGQFTVPVGAELLTPTEQIDFAARYYAQDRMLNPSCNHDTGIMASGKVLKDRVQYYAGIFNGKGANYSDNDNEKFLYAGRAVWTAYSGKLLGRDASFTFGGSAMSESTRNDPSSLKSADIGAVTFTRAYRRNVYGGDFGLRVGPAFLKSEYIAARLDGQRTDSEINAYGWHITAAWRFPGEKVELLARRQGYDPNTAHRTSKDIKWTTLGLNWFINGNNARLLTNYTFKSEAASSTHNDEVVTQLQLMF